MDKRKEILIAALRESDEEIRKSAAEALERIDTRDRLDALAGRIESGEMLEKIRVIYAVSELKGPRVAEMLTKALKDPSEDVRAAVVRALANMADPATLAALAEALKDTSPIVARAAAEALCGFRDPRLLGPLMQALKHQDTGVVERAMEAVARIGDKRSEEAFVYFASKGNPKMRAIALRALGVMDR